MMQLAIVTAGTLVGRLRVRDDGGIALGPDVAYQIGLRAGDEVEVHSDGSLLVLLPVRTDPHGQQRDAADCS